MDNAPLILLAAGGTGGHLFPAEALGVELIKRGLRVRLATDARALRYSGLFTREMIDVVPSETVRSRNPVSLARTAIMLGYGTVVALNLVRRLKPAAVVGFGGYPTLPPLLAARWLGVPGIIHDANAVLGRANRFLSSRVDAVATSLPGVLDRDPSLAGKTTTVGTPMRPAILAAAAVPFAAPEPNGPLRVLVVGGSQGARVMSDIVPGAIERLEPALWSRLVLTQQVREEDMARVRAVYDRLKINAELAPFFADLPAKLASSQLVISRSGAGTVAELAAIGRPSILVPLPGAIDQDQFANAGVLSQANGALRIPQTEFTPDRLAAEISALCRRACKTDRDGHRRPQRRPAGCGGTVGRSGRESGRNLGQQPKPGHFYVKAGLVPAIHVFHKSAKDVDARDVWWEDALRAFARAGRQHTRDNMRLPREIGPIHFVGIGGIGMSGIAEVLSNLGYTVQGSDASESGNVARLRAKGITVSIGHKAENVDGADVVVVSTAIKRDNPELMAARAQRIPVVRRAEMLAELMRLKSCVAIAGTHGKTTTTTMVATLLDAGDLDPTVINGGIINAYGSNARLGAGDWMVVEADESDGTFLKLPSDVVIVTNIDPEHLDHFKTFEAIQDAFRNFVENVPFYGFAVMCTDHPVVQTLVGKIEDRRIITYGENPQADARLIDLTPMGAGSKFKVAFRNRKTDATHEIAGPDAADAGTS